MDKPKVWIMGALPKEAMELIEAHCEVVGGDARTLAEADLSEIEGLLQSGQRIDEELLRRAPRLRTVSNVSVGYNNYRITAMRERGVTGTHTPYVLDDTTADLVFALILAAARRVPELDRLVKDGRWGAEGEQGEDHFGVDVHHATLGIIGMGRIGEAVVKRGALGFDMKVLYHNRTRKPEAEERLGAEYRSLPDLLQESDFVVLMAPLTPETRKLIGREQLQAMKRSAIFINASRGPLVDEEALEEALERGWIRGAGLDVYSVEPVPGGHPLLRFPNVVTLPHIGSATAQTRHGMAVLAANNLVGALLRDRPVHVVPELQELL